MEDTIKNLLETEIESGMAEISHHDYSNDTKTKAIMNMEKLHKLYMDERKLEADREAAIMQHELELAKLEEDKQYKKAQRKEKAFEIGVSAATVVANLALGIFGYSWYRKRYHEGLEFEKTGTITAQQTRNLISSMLPKFKK